MAVTCVREKSGTAAQRHSGTMGFYKAAFWLLVGALASMEVYFGVGECSARYETRVV